MIFLLIPVYNEEANISTLYYNLSKIELLNNAQFIFIDDYSTDNTIAHINKLFNNKNFIVLTKDKNIGPGHSFNLGFEWILNNSKSDNDIVITMEADNTSSLEILEKMISISNLGFDLVLASPYSQGGGFKKTTIIRKILSFTANVILRSIFSIKVQTLSSFYRVYSIRLLRKIKSKYSNLIRQNGFTSMLEVLLKAIKCDASIIEVPMLLDSGIRVGKSNMKIIKTSFEYLKFLFFYGRKI